MVSYPLDSKELRCWNSSFVVTVNNKKVHCLAEQTFSVFGRFGVNTAWL